MRRRTKPRVVWVPVTNTNSVDATNRSAIQRTVLVVDHTVQGNFDTVEIPCVLDGAGSSPLDATSTLSDIENSGYRLRRIVGEVWIDCASDADATLDRPDFIVTAAFIIRRTNQAGASLAAQGAASEIAADDIENNMDPWIWRRSWRMQNRKTNDTLDITNDTMQRMLGMPPNTNYSTGNGGSLYQGPHIDQKTARIVGPEERLFLDVSATVIIAADTAATTTTSFLIHSNLRVLGSMRTSVGNRRNASR